MKAEQVRILLVEDNPADVYLFRMALQNTGLDFELTVMNDGTRAIQFIAGLAKLDGGSPLDLAVLDMNLPMIGGTEVLDALRQNECLATVPVVMFSSSPLPPDSLQGKQNHRTCYITKPLDLDGFLEIGAVLKQMIFSAKAES